MGLGTKDWSALVGSRLESIDLAVREKGQYTFPDGVTEGYTAPKAASILFDIKRWFYLRERAGQVGGYNGDMAKHFAHTQTTLEQIRRSCPRVHPGADDQPGFV